MAEESPEKRARTEIPKLLYFNIAGKGEAIRLAFHYGNIKFEDHHFKEGEFMKMKESGELQFGQVPALVVRGQTLTQSAAILRYVGKQAGLYPDDAVTAAQVDAIMDQEADALMGMRITKYKGRFGFGDWIMTDDNVMRLQKEMNADILPKHLNQLETVLRTGGTGWLAGTPGPTIADFFWVPTLQMLEKGQWNGDTKLMESFSGLRELIKRFLALPAVAAYYAAKQ